ncbi:MAG: DUF1853 family protein [Akkermansiaceae bacterium]
MDSLLRSQLLIDSLVEGQLLARSLGSISCFDRIVFRSTSIKKSFNFQQKLGHLYEDALERTLQLSDVVSELRSSIQVFEGGRSGGRTLGELDFLFRLGEDIVHLELAVKFYCAVQINGELRWYGPDARDHWERKRMKMISHQLGMARTPDGKALIQELYGVDSVQTQHLIYGCLFDPISTDSKEVAVDVSPEASRGKWLWRRELDEHFTSDKLWFIPKCLWPCDPSTDLLAVLDRVSKKQLLEVSAERGVMFTDGESRYFLVCDHWLDSAVS